MAIPIMPRGQMRPHGMYQQPISGLGNEAGFNTMSLLANHSPQRWQRAQEADALWRRVYDRRKPSNSIFLLGNFEQCRRASEHVVM